MPQRSRNSVPHGGRATDQRRRWDSNPRYREAVHRFSRPALSTTQAPLRAMEANDLSPTESGQMSVLVIEPISGCRFN